jgi:hypothetical protein
VPKAAAIDRVTACRAGWSSGVTHGRTPGPYQVIAHSMPGGTTVPNQVSTLRWMSPGS